MLWALFSLPLERFVACRTSLFSRGLLTMPLTGPLMDPLIAPLMFSESVSVDLDEKLPGDQDCRFFFFCSFSCVESVCVCDCDCITDLRNRFADSRETASLNLESRFCEASVSFGGSGMKAPRFCTRMRPGGVRRGLKKSRLREERWEVVGVGVGDG